MEFDHENRICASLGHYVAGITLAYCPHRGQWVAVIRAGDEADDTSWRWLRLDFGPFDSQPEIERRVLSEVQRLLRADHQGWLAARAEPGSGAAPTTGG